MKLTEEQVRAMVYDLDNRIVDWRTACFSAAHKKYYHRYNPYHKFNSARIYKRRRRQLFEEGKIRKLHCSLERSPLIRGQKRAINIFLRAVKEVNSQRYKDPATVFKHILQNKINELQAQVSVGETS